MSSWAIEQTCLMKSNASDTRYQSAKVYCAMHSIVLTFQEKQQVVCIVRNF